jgi:hypothetical protein
MSDNQNQDMIDKLEKQHVETVKREFSASYDHWQENTLREQGLVCQMCRTPSRPNDIFCSAACETLARR